MTFPTANSVVYYNEDGEPMGWDTYRDEAPEYYEEDYYLYADDEEIDPEDCEHANVGNIKDVLYGEEGLCDDCGYHVARRADQASWYA